MPVLRLRGVCVLAVIAVLSACNGPETDSESPEINERRVAIEGPRDPDAPVEFTETASGLKYRILRASDGDHPTEGDTVTCHYRGWLDDGTEFDSSYKRVEPATFSLQGVIAGWTEGMQLVGEGGMIELELPPHLGYGQRGSPPEVPGGATLHFIVELIEIE